MTPKEMLEQTRRLINEHAAGDPDKWWYANRFVFNRLMLDERKSKAGVKQKLLDAGVPCHACGKRFESRRDIHLHRLDGDKGYSDANCVLMHKGCHEAHHARTDEDGTAEGRARRLVCEKLSKRYDDMPFLYWWDVSPSLAESLDDFEVLEFVKKDTRERCVVPIQALKGFLVPARQSSRGQGQWGVKVLRDRPDELAFGPGTGKGKWLFLPVVWLAEAED